MNPELVRIARDHFGLTIDAVALAALAYDGGIFKPQPVIDSLRALTRSIDTFSVEPRLVVSTFADVSGVMSRDGGSLDHQVLNALAGHVGDREQVTAPRATPITSARTIALRHPTTSSSTPTRSRRRCSPVSLQGTPSPWPLFRVPGDADRHQRARGAGARR